MTNGPLLITDLPLKRLQDTIAVWILGHPSCPSKKNISDPLSEHDWQYFGSRFKFQCQSGRWSVETDPVGAFVPTLLALDDGIFLADGHLRLMRLCGVEWRENPDWLADMLISGYPHDNTSILLPFERLPANSFIAGEAGGLQIRSEGSFVSNLPMPLSPMEAVEESRNALHKVLSSLPEEGIGIHLTGGYDSRLILASLLRLGIRPKTFIFGIKENYNSQIAEKVARALNLEHLFIPLNTNFDKQFGEVFEKSALLSGGISSLSHTHVLYATEKIADKVSYLLAGIGGGELHRGLLRENVAFPWILANLLRHGEECEIKVDTSSLVFKMFPDLRDLLFSRIEDLTFKWKSECRKGRLVDVLLRNVFGNYFRSIMVLENSCLSTLYPYLDPRAMKALLRSPFGLVYGDNMRASALFKLKCQRSLVEEYLPTMYPFLNIKMDKGFPHEYLLSPWKWPMIPLKVYISRRRRANLGELNNSKWLWSLLSKWEEAILLLLPELDRSVWKQFINTYWTQSERYTMSRILHIALCRNPSWDCIV